MTTRHFQQEEGAVSAKIAALSMAALFAIGGLSYWAFTA
jgi:hypothetical protein